MPFHLSIRHALAAGWLSLCGFAAGAAQEVPAADAAAMPIASFFKRPEFQFAQLSPSGRYLGVLQGNDTQRTRLVVLDLDDGMRVSIAAVFDDADVSKFQWLNDKRLVFGMADRHTDSAERRRPPGLWAVDRDGDGFRQLIESAYWWQEGLRPPDKIKRILPPLWHLHSVPEGGSDDILVEEYRFDAFGVVEATNVRRMNTRTGLLRLPLGSGNSANQPPGTVGWLFDPAGQPAVVRTESGSTEALHRRDAKTGEWKLLAERPLSSRQWWFDPVLIDGDQRLYVRAPNVQGVLALYRWDDAAGRPEPKPLLSMDGFDIGTNLITRQAGRELAGAHVLADGWETRWFDPEMRELQRQVDAALQGMRNLLDCVDCTRRVLVHSFSDRDPGAYFLLDRQTGSMRPLFQARPWIDPQRMGRVDFTRFKARDGRAIPVVVTTPPQPASGRRPAIVFVHGGPWLRGGDGAWDGWAQFLASRGYVVIAPEFRGSAGFGFDHFRAGWKQWGLAMQDDLDDALAWAAAERGVDARRACIMGASYGGYAALMGLVRDDSPYRCAVEWVGVADIELIYSEAQRDRDDSLTRYGINHLMGDPSKDIAQLRATSPLRQAAKIRAPLLMAYGEQDLIVPFAHGKKLRAALPKDATNVEWVTYPNEGHGWFELATKLDFASRVESFLDRQIGSKAGIAAVSH
jgi:dipeptidyl aminopeptidase/acylaminoacyl peptidase